MRHYWLLPLCGAALITTPAHADPKSWNTVSNIGRDGLVVAALGLPVVQRDWRGAERSGLSMGAASIVTFALKRSINERRPDGSDIQSFPSGHTSVSFAAAATLEKRYGWAAGIPAHIVAALVGVARVKADKHFVHDVVAGAAIGEASGWLLTRRKNDRVQWLPWGDAHGGGMAMSMRF
ncbi:phosphatase PAP2 family protein [Sphingomonas flavescens]|uniref:phosphatase PAP2 family protein n=1 Tax=Sphingomonas flavescens TaxID=3132797 RepID=UPI0028042516|nr:phosphatase PAP2 family protein [Sphingomonas limnosediminicola]